MLVSSPLVSAAKRRAQILYGAEASITAAQLLRRTGPCAKCLSPIGNKLHRLQR